MLNFFAGRQAAPAGPRLSPQDILTKVQAGEMQLIDVREHNEVAMSGIAKGALHIPLAVLRFQADPSGPDFHPELDQSKPIALYCASGARSGMAAQLMQGLGYGEVHNLGGLGHWQMAGGEIVRG
jgi:rhodanese-related sulfurtransferase